VTNGRRSLPADGTLSRVTNPHQDPNRAANVHRKLSNLQLGLYIAVPVIFVVVFCCCFFKLRG